MSKRRKEEGERGRGREMRRDLSERTSEGRTRERKEGGGGGQRGVSE